MVLVPALTRSLMLRIPVKVRDILMKMKKMKMKMKNMRKEEKKNSEGDIKLRTAETIKRN